MDASSKLKPGLIKGQCNEAIREIEADNQDFETMKSKITEFTNETEIKSKKFDNMKLQLGDYLLIIDHMIAANNANIADYQTLSDTVGDEDLEGATLIEEKTNAEQAKASALQAAYNARSLANYWRPVDAIQAMNLDQIAMGYDQEASNWQEVINIIQSKMDFYDSVESSTAGLFSSASAIQMTLSEAMTDVTGAFKGGRYVYNEEAVWRNELSELTSYYVEVDEDDPLLALLNDGKSIAQLGFDKSDEISLIKGGVYFTLKKVDGKYRVFLDGSKVNGSSKMTWTQMQNYLNNNFEDISWSKYNVKTMVKDGIKYNSRKGETLFDVRKAGKYTDSVAAMETIDKFGHRKYTTNVIKDSMNPLENYTNWKTASKAQKLEKDLV